jgi:maltooligosyltrehalose trehalohydrolase
MKASIRPGATLLGNQRCRFDVWAPRAEAVDVRLTAPEQRRVPLDRHVDGTFVKVVGEIGEGCRYLYRLQYADGATLERPDPASRHQPEGVHGPSAIVSADFAWDDGAWCGLPLSRYVIYELHVGAFTPEGTFDAVIGHLDELVHLGVTALELMPVAQFPGSRNWGYDGVYPFAVQASYGGPRALKRLVNACHRRGLAVVLDVVYNHLGPEGNYLRDFGPYFTDFYQTPWGEAVNFDGPFSDPVRRYFIQNALQWVDEFRIDALRLDAVHAILDFSARPFLEQLARAVHRRAAALDRRIHLIAESALNDTRIIRPRALGGFDLDAQWNDDFHHSLHTALTGERTGYYRDFDGLADLARAWREGYVYTGQYSKFRQRSHGNASRNIPARQLVVFAQNHDQVGNRLLGDRLAVLVSFEKLKLAAGLVILSPFIPLIFMGEEYGETAPFPYFISHTDPDLVQAVREGRRKEFAAFDWQTEPPDPQSQKTYAQARLNRSLLDQARHRTLLEYHRELLSLRTRLPALANLSKKHMTVTGDRHRHLLQVQRWFGDDSILMWFNFNSDPGPLPIEVPAGRWRKRMDSADTFWEGPGSAVADELWAEADERVEIEAAPNSMVVFQRQPGLEQRLGL